MLKDAQPEVRFQTAICCAGRGDKRAGLQALWSVLQEGRLEHGYNSTAMQTVQTLTGSYFGYKLDEPSTSAANRAALDKLAAWIQSQP